MWEEMTRQWIIKQVLDFTGRISGFPLCNLQSSPVWLQAKSFICLWLLKGIVHPKKFLSSFAPPHVIPNLYESLSSVEHNWKKKIDDCFQCSWICCVLGQWREWKHVWAFCSLWNSRGWFPSQNILFRSAVPTGHGFTVAAGHAVGWGCNSRPVPTGLE